jgi:dolichyl-phosphate-mannose-protein mannosyltransferase
MAATSTPQGSVRQRNVPGASKKKDAGGISDVELEYITGKDKTKKPGAGNEREYKATFVLMTILAFITRFWGISHPNEVVFDEVHFGKVCLSNLWVRAPHSR